MVRRMTSELADLSLEDLVAACRHLEDLDVFVGQRSRMHPGPGWAPVLDMLRRDLDAVSAEMHRRGVGRRVGRALGGEEAAGFAT